LHIITTQHANQDWQPGGKFMPKIPDPKELLDIAKSARRVVEDREWKKYQRYLAKHQQKFGKSRQEQPISFRKYCAWLRFFEEDMEIPQ
jgi:hypothetical protein